MAIAGFLWSVGAARRMGGRDRAESTYRRPMTQDQIDRILEEMQAAFEKTGEAGERPGLITFDRDDWIGARIPSCCTSLGRGIRTRGIQVKVAKGRETRVWTRAEALAMGEDPDSFEDLKSREDAKA
ncbi:hypothetical protein [Caulobacter sp.]|uniref:hypothetical protein n=1 Tax=Caulobacter sp. TaxID=78 RepID=UPI0031DA211E